MNTPGIFEVLLSFVLVAVSIIISRVWKIDVVKDMAFGSVRAFIQLVAVGYAINIIFDLKSTALMIMAIMIMITVGAFAAASRVKKVDKAFGITFAAMTVASLVTISIMLLFKIIEFEARYLIPLGGMIIGNSMNASALSIDRITSDIYAQRPAIESSLALGKKWHDAAAVYIRSAATAGMISILNFMKTAGIVALPGAMTGMILAGADPVKAVFLQVIVVNMLLMATFMASLITAELTVRKFFNKNHQLTI